MISEPPHSLIKEPPNCMEAYSYQGPPSFLNDLIYPPAAFCCWQEVQERGVLMKRSNAAAGWRRLSLHNERWNASAETLVSDSSLILHEALPFLNIVQHFSCFARGAPSSWSALSHLNYLLEHWTPVWNPQIYFSDSEGNTCCVYFSLRGSISSPVE